FDRNQRRRAQPPLPVHPLRIRKIVPTAIRRHRQPALAPRHLMRTPLRSLLRHRRLLARETRDRNSSLDAREDEVGGRLRTTFAHRAPFASVAARPPPVTSTVWA